MSTLLHFCTGKIALYVRRGDQEWGDFYYIHDLKLYSKYEEDKIRSERIIQDKQLLKIYHSMDYYITFDLDEALKTIPESGSGKEFLGMKKKDGKIVNSLGVEVDNVYVLDQCMEQMTGVKSFPYLLEEEEEEEEKEEEDD